MKFQSRLLMLLPACLLFAGAAPGENPKASAVDMPQILYRPTAEHPWPEFLAADAAIDAKGELYESLMDPVSIGGMKYLLSQPAIGECLLQENQYRGADYGHARGTLEASLQNSPLVIHGEVTGQQYGFRFGAAGQLMAVRPIETFGMELPHDEYFFFLPVGEFRAGPYQICKTDTRYEYPPAVGDEVLLMVPKFKSLSDRFLNIDDDSSLVTFFASGADASLPWWHQREARPPVSKDQIMSLATESRSKREAGQ